MRILEVPLHEVNIKSSLINGNIVIGVRPSLPVEGISLILGNDLAGERENSFTGANVLISGVEMRILEVPPHEVNIKSSLINGNIVIGVRPSLPVEGISLILGNDLAGERVMVDPRVVEKPRDDEKTERLAEKFPGIFPASVVTRSIKAKKEVIKEQGMEEIGLSGTFLENIDGKFEERNEEKAEEVFMRNESRNVNGNIP